MKWDRRSKLIKISKYAIIICLVLSIIFAGFTIYGNKVGNFILSVDRKNGVSLSLSDREDLGDKTARLAAKGLDEQSLATLSDIPKDITKGVGVKNAKFGQLYMAYSFYLLNESGRTVDYTVGINILETHLGADEVVRVMVIEGESERGRIFAKSRADGTPEEHTPENMEKGTEPYTTIPFQSETEVGGWTVTSFGDGASQKYTIVVWLEGEDEQATDAIMGSGIRMSLTFTGY